jgi:hypothetical protein
MSDKMIQPAPGYAGSARRIGTEINVAAGRVRLVRIEGAVSDLAMEPDRFVVSLNLTPRRNAKGCFPRCWGAQAS